MEIFIIVIVAIAALVGLYIWSQYNDLVRLNERIEEAWSDISVQLKYRADLIPNIVSTVKGYASHEEKVFADVSDARSRLMGAGSDVKAAAKAEGELSNALSRLMAISEAYPELKANQGFMQLQNQLQEIEDKIQGARRFYNAGVRDLNIKIKVFPTNIFAKKLGFEAREFFEVENRKALEDAPEVKF
ncbi:MAG: LemA family protein [bacterium]|nr:LemA family protein [bacterium]